MTTDRVPQDFQKLGPIPMSLGFHTLKALGLFTLLPGAAGFSQDSQGSVAKRCRVAHVRCV